MRTIRHLLENKTVWAVDARFSALDAARYMSERVIGAVPVVEDGRLLGTISMRDLLADDLEEKDEEVKLLTDYVQYVPPGHGES